MVTLVDNVKQPPRARHPEKVNRPDNPIQRKPEWIRVKAPGSPVYKETQEIVKENGLFTVCEEAGCPNIGECWSKKHATMMIMGDTCTRACAFCNVKTGLPAPLDADEPANVAEAVERLGLHHVVITSVDRDDLKDGGAEHFAQVIRAIRARSPSTTIEVLTPDFLRKDGALEVVVAARPDVFNHNLETVPSNYLTVRPGARYFHSIRLLQRVKELDPTIFTKSGIMVGLGEERNEAGEALGRRAAGEADRGAGADRRVGVGEGRGGNAPAQGGQGFDGNAAVIDGEPLVERVQLRHFQRFFRKIDAGDAGSGPGQRFGQDAATAAHVDDAGAGQRSVVVDIPRAQRIDLVQGLELAVQIPPFVGHLAELVDFNVVDVFLHGATSCKKRVRGPAVINCGRQCARAIRPRWP